MFLFYETARDHSLGFLLINFSLTQIKRRFIFKIVLVSVTGEVMMYFQSKSHGVKVSLN